MPRVLTLHAQRRGSITVYPVPDLTRLGVDAFVTDRFNGVSGGVYDSLNLGDHVGDEATNVRTNRALVARAAGVEPARLVTVRQVHGARAVQAENVDEIDGADAIVTEDPRLALAILVADCVPLAVASESSSRVAVVHAGWRGLDAGVIAEALREFDASTTHVFLGPCISAEAYQIGPEVAARFADVPGALTPDVGDRSRLDLRAVALFQLREAGVPDENITMSREVTDGGEIFYSDRSQRPCGRFALVARRAVA